MSNRQITYIALLYCIWIKFQYERDDYKSMFQSVCGHQETDVCILINYYNRYVIKVFSYIYFMPIALSTQWQICMHMLCGAYIEVENKYFVTGMSSAIQIIRCSVKLINSLLFRLCRLSDKMYTNLINA